MTTIQLRRYTIESGRMDDFIMWWRSIIEPRAKYGFRVVFAYADDAHSEFVWAVAHDGDFDTAESRLHGIARACRGVLRRTRTS